MWSDLYLREEWRIPKPRHRIAEAVINLRTQTQALKAHSDRLRRRIRELTKLLNKSEEEVTTLLNTSQNNLGLSKVDRNSNGHSRCLNFKILFLLLDQSRLTRGAIMNDLRWINTLPVSRLIPTAATSCPVCSLIIAYRTPCVRQILFFFFFT